MLYEKGIIESGYLLFQLIYKDTEISCETSRINLLLRIFTCE